mmetsp:Transcript_3224/g.12317  ORF Transcript_3224/g.12317 Transcript_3224/m.12317 type:complete len:134 (+) Transcript_3224:873-1274(+)
MKGSGLLGEGGKYATLGGPTRSWCKAALKRLFGWTWVFPGDAELFWVRFPDTVDDLVSLAAAADHGLAAPHVAHEFPFSARGVEAAFAQLRTRRTRGKVIVRVGGGEGGAAQKTTTRHEEEEDSEPSSEFSSS